ncbi:MAG TPA: hypothetical protein VK815_05455 [Candidatus Acidoferrales bacterium]|jgi:hypothetical protein|nr:hypothetical protein [Candidatus Acidoferrales bacterium]
MLLEKNTKPTQSDFARRWLTDDYFDLIVWYEPGGGIHGFQLCYDKPGRERALTWTQSRGFAHNTVDSGEPAPDANLTPVLVPDGAFQAVRVREEFLKRCTQMDALIRNFVLGKIDEFAAGKKSAA